MTGQTSLVDPSMEGYGSKSAVLPTLLLMMKYMIFRNGGAYPQSANRFHNPLYE
jgi:hypothetical protein